METFSELFKTHLRKSRKIMSKSYTKTNINDINWLNDFCAAFLQFSNCLHKFIATELEKSEIDRNENVETIFLCLTQIVTCIRHMERTIKAEETGGIALSASFQYFQERLHWCLERTRVATTSITSATDNGRKTTLDDQSFVQLMDSALDYLSQFSSFQENSDNITNIAQKNADIMFTSKQIRFIIDLILSHTLAFANVALKQDKKALSALCQKVLRECNSFQDDCLLNQSDFKLNESNRKLKAMSLETALYQLEDYINEALLRLVYVCFLDFDKFSIDKLRSIIRSNENDDATVDEIIADFDVNIDRTTQIGIFAIAFAPNIKMKTIIRSCLASFESLDTCLVPSLQTKLSDLHSEILQQHFNEEVINFKTALQEIIDSQAFISCYFDMLTECICDAEKHFQKCQLQEMVQMGEFLRDHFQIDVNQKLLHGESNRLELFEKFVAMLRECQAILMCADQVNNQRILKRFKILRSTLRKLLNAFSNCSGQLKRNKSKIFIMSDELSTNQQSLESVGISPSIRSILYCIDTPMRRKRAASDSLRGNHSKIITNHDETEQSVIAAVATPQPELKLVLDSAQSNREREQRNSVRRKESLRTAMFKRQKSSETEKIYQAYKNQSDSFQISDILDQLTDLSSSFSHKTRNIDIIASI